MKENKEKLVKRKTFIKNKQYQKCMANKEKSGFPNKYILLDSNIQNKQQENIIDVKNILYFSYLMQPLFHLFD